MSEEVTPQVEDLMDFFYYGSVAMLQTDPTGKVLLMNPVAVQLLMPMAKPGDFLENLFITLGTAAPELRTIVNESPDRPGRILTRYRMVLPSGIRGRAGPIFLELSMVRLSAGLLMTTIEDVTDSVRRERLLQKEQAWINAMFAGTSDHGQIQLDTHGVIVSWNDDMQRLTGYSASERTGRPYDALFPPDGITKERMMDRLAEVASHGLSVAEGKMIRADGSTYWGHSVITRDVSSSGGYVFLLRDLSEYTDTIESLLKAATSDPLTGVGNRRALYEVAELEFARHARSPRDISLLLLDIDHFKRVNDTYGHPAGDQVIRNFASVMINSLRSVDVVARLGGEEFAVLLPSTSLEMAVQVAERIRRVVASQQVTTSEGVIRYRASIGVAQVTPEITDIGKLILAADQALYQAKRRGRDRVCVHTD